MGDAQDHSGVAVAKITATQAVVVALITSAASVGVTYVTTKRNSDSPKAAIQRWISIDGIDAEEGVEMRVVINVNGTNFSYPSRAVWGKVGPRMSPEKFPLPINATTYRISFAGFSNIGRIGTFTSQEVAAYDDSKLPIAGLSYRLFTLTDGIREPNSTVNISWSIE